MSVRAPCFDLEGLGIFELYRGKEFRETHKEKGADMGRIYHPFRKSRSCPGNVNMVFS